MHTLFVLSISFAETMQLDRFFLKKKVAAVAKKNCLSTTKLN
jgi:hypothetical protein